MIGHGHGSHRRWYRLEAAVLTEIESEYDGFYSEGHGPGGPDAHGLRVRIALWELVLDPYPRGGLGTLTIGVGRR